jgi:hypothetical protein
MKKIKALMWLVVALCLMMAMGCMGLSQFQARTEKAGETDRNKVYATAAIVENGLGPQAVAIQFHLEAKDKELASQKTTVTMSAPASTQPAEFVPPEKSPRGKKANLTPCRPASKPQPVAPQVVVTEQSFFNPTVPMGGAGGAGIGFLQDWVGKALLATGEAFSGSFAPGVNVVVGGAKAIAGGGKGGSATGGAGGAGGSASSSSASSASAAAAAAGP